jgi:hypothetical protein
VLWIGARTTVNLAVQEIADAFVGTDKIVKSCKIQRFVFVVR